MAEESHDPIAPQLEALNTFLRMYAPAPGECANSYGAPIDQDDEINEHRDKAVIAAFNAIERFANAFARDVSH